MSSKLPTWVGVGAFLLSFSAGCINAFTLVSAIALPVSHYTGTSTALAIAVASGDAGRILLLSGLIASFVAGATASGLVIRDYHLKLGRRYGIALMAESALVSLAFVAYADDPTVSLFLLAFACGLQNAMATTYSGAVVRTTHVTGILTDLGTQLAKVLLGNKVERRRVALFLSILSGFILGGVLTTALFPLIGRYVLFVVVALTGGTGLSYYAYRQFVVTGSSSLTPEARGDTLSHDE